MDMLYFFMLLAMMCGLMVMLTTNAVHSVIWLIGAFLSVTGIFFWLKVDYLAFMLMMMYVGAISVLFLFVIMMLNLNNLTNEMNKVKTLGPGLFMSAFLFLMILGQSAFVGGFRWDPMTCLSNIQLIGIELYSGCYYLMILVSYILLVAMIGVIVLARELNSGAKKQNMYMQINRF